MKRLLQNTCLLLLAGSRVTIAQPATDNTPKAPNPRNMGGVAAKTPAEIAAEDKAILAGRADTLKRFAEIDAKLDALTPEQDQEEMRLENEPLLRQKFNQAGFKDLALQDSVLDFVSAQEKSRRPVREAAAEVYDVLGSEADAATVKASMTAFVAAVEVAKTARETATAALDAKIHFSANPPLEALLTLNGLIGESSWLTSEVIELGDENSGAVTFYLPPSPPEPEPVDPATQTPAQKAEEDKKILAAAHYGRDMALAMMKMTPAQGQEWNRKVAEKLLRRDLADYGVEKRKDQDAVVAFVAAQEKSRLRVREAAKAVYLGVEPQGAAISKTEMSARLGKYLASAEQVHAERETATRNLDAQIRFSANPLLLARLTLDGLIGESSWFCGYVLPTGALSIDTLDVVR